MIRRICRECGSEMTKELTPEGARFFCKECDRYTLYDEFDMDPYCPDCRRTSSIPNAVRFFLQ
jgi:Zn finger protein HypA/HybF involved in hydrogenase expression